MREMTEEEFGAMAPAFADMNGNRATPAPLPPQLRNLIDWSEEQREKMRKVKQG